MKTFRPVLREKPVPKGVGNYEKFRSTLTKAALTFDYIEESENYQYAILSNRDNDTAPHVDDIRPSKEYTLVYTSELDGKVHIKRLEYKDVHITPRVETEYRNEYIPGNVPFKDGYVGIKVMHGYHSGKIDNPGMGLIAHNGQVIIQPKFSYICNIQDSYILAYSFLYPKQGGYWDTNVFLFDYQGRVILKIHSYSMGLNGLILEGFKINEDPVAVIAHHGITEFGAKLPKGGKVDGRIYLIYHGELYRSLKYSDEPHMITVHEGKVYIGPYAEYVRKKVYIQKSPEELLENAEKVIHPEDR